MNGGIHEYVRLHGKEFEAAILMKVVNYLTLKQGFFFPWDCLSEDNFIEDVLRSERKA